jgi:hypothetical protein
MRRYFVYLIRVTTTRKTRGYKKSSPAGQVHRIRAVRGRSRGVRRGSAPHWDNKTDLTLQQRRQYLIITRILGAGDHAWLTPIVGGQRPNKPPAGWIVSSANHRPANRPRLPHRLARRCHVSQTLSRELGSIT